MPGRLSRAAGWLLCCWINGVAAGAIDLQGHRGARGLAPENTLPAFALALSIGVTTLELDAGVTSDHTVVVLHDLALNPDITRNGRGEWLTRSPLVHSLTLERLKTFDVGRIRPESEYAGKFARQQPSDGTRIPTFAEVVALARRAGNEAVRFNVETKIRPDRPDATVGPQRFAELLVAAMRAGGVAQRSSIQSFDWRTLARVQAIAPEIETVYLSVQQDWMDTIAAGGQGPSMWTNGMDAGDYGDSVPRMVKAAGGDVWSPYYGDLDKRNLAEAHALGLRVIVWTVNDPDEMHLLMLAGVDGIISDYPDRLREAARAARLPLPARTPVEP